MLGVRVTYADGQTIDTNINATLEEARAYFIGQEFQFGDTEECPQDRMVRAVAVEEITP